MCELEIKPVFSELNRFVYSGGITAPFHTYPLMDENNKYDVYLFHAQVQPYGKNGLCLRLPHGVSRAMGDDCRNYLAIVQLMSFGEELNGAVHLFHRHLRGSSGYNVITIPDTLHKDMDLRHWTVAISLLDRSMLLQYDGFVYPSFLKLHDPLRVCENIIR